MNPVQRSEQRSGLANECQKCGKPGEVFYYQGIEASLCGDCLKFLDEIVKYTKQPNSHELA